jgi:hypothetical protein
MRAVCFLSRSRRSRIAPLTRWSSLGATILLLCCGGSLRAVFAHSSSLLGQAKALASVDDNQCRQCHSYEVDGFARSKMARSMRLADQEPSGLVRAQATTITMFSNKEGSWQRRESDNTASTYHVDYVIGSGTHASGYLISLANHLFQSPVAYYASRSSYDLAPGFEGRPNPDFTRPIDDGCLFCHAGSVNAVTGTDNMYDKTPFSHLAITCSRCHGPTAKHLIDPKASNIVNPLRLETASRDSICEQCHLLGVVRVLNPQKRFKDFQAGQRLEDTFTIYQNATPKGTEASLRVISHAEQLALSQCAIKSAGGLWCGTCHDPHNEPADAVPYYRQKCMRCHGTTSFAAGHPGPTSDCIGCHMPKRAATDGGHSAFTDHWIQRRPQSGAGDVIAGTNPSASSEEDAGHSIAPWREPPLNLVARNQGIALIEVGLARNSADQVANGYRTLAGVQAQFSQDSETYNAMAKALYAERNYDQAAQLLQIAVRFDPQSSPKESSLGQAYAALGKQELAVLHLEKAMQLDPLNLSAGLVLIKLYDANGQAAKAGVLAGKIAALFNNQTGNE